VTYDEVVAVFFVASPDGVVRPPVASPARRLRDAVEPIAMHAVWSRRTNERLAALGFEFLTAYVAGRAADLGEPDAGVVVSSFAVFEPGMLTAAYELARATCDRSTMLAARTEATIESLTETLAGVPLGEVTDVAERLAAAVTAADPTGRPLFAGLANQPWPDDPVGRLWRACDLLREHRGDSHVAASVTAGVDPIAMNVLTELWVGMPLGTYSATRGWTPERLAATAGRLRGQGLLDGDQLSRRGQVWRDGLEATTDAQERPIVEALGDDFDDLVARLDEWSARCVAAGAFPPDVFKRAAG
jgi:Helix-turn-helix family